MSCKRQRAGQPLTKFINEVCQGEDEKLPCSICQRIVCNPIGVFTKINNSTTIGVVMCIECLDEDGSGQYSEESKYGDIYYHITDETFMVKKKKKKHQNPEVSEVDELHEDGYPICLCQKKTIETQDSISTQLDEQEPEMSQPLLTQMVAEVEHKDSTSSCTFESSQPIDPLPVHTTNQHVTKVDLSQPIGPTQEPNTEDKCLQEDDIEIESSQPTRTNCNRICDDETLHSKWYQHKCFGCGDQIKIEDQMCKRCLRGY